MNEEERKAYMKEYRQNNKDQIAKQKKGYRDRPGNKEKVQKQHLKRKYDLTQEEYDKMLEQQNNKCVICGDYETNKRKGEIQSLSVDHCHKTGKIRGLLCNNCNLTLGYSKEDIYRLNKCIEFIKKWK